MIRDHLSNFILRAPQSSGRSAGRGSLIPNSKNAVSFSIRMHNETLSVVMRASNPDRSPDGIHG
jgi:hypothetical protein